MRMMMATSIELDANSLQSMRWRSRRTRARERERGGKKKKGLQVCQSGQALDPVGALCFSRLIRVSISRSGCVITRER